MFFTSMVVTNRQGDEQTVVSPAPVTSLDHQTLAIQE